MVVNVIYLRVLFLRIPFSLLFQVRIEQRTSWEVVRYSNRQMQRCPAGLSLSSVSSMLCPAIVLTVDQLWPRDRNVTLGCGLTLPIFQMRKKFSLLVPPHLRIKFPRGRGWGPSCFGLDYTPAHEDKHLDSSPKATTAHWEIGNFFVCLCVCVMNLQITS